MASFVQTPNRGAWRGKPLSKAFSRPIPIIPFGAAEARLHGSIGGALMKVGNVVATNDLAIAVTALVRGDTVITRDKRGFERVPGLDVSYW